MACLDTMILLDVSGQGGVARRRRAACKMQELVARKQKLVTTRFNVAELYVGLHKARDRRRETERIQLVLRGLEILEFTEAAAQSFGNLIARLHRLGRPIGDMDTLIAATTLAGGHCLVTRNPAHFADIPEFVVESY